MEGFDAGTHYFDVMDGTGTTVAVGYCMNLGRVNPEVMDYDAGVGVRHGARSPTSPTTATQAPASSPGTS